MFKFFGQLTLKAKLILAFLVLGLGPALVIAAIAWNNATKSLIQSAQQQLTTVRETKKRQVRDLLTTMIGQVKTQADSKLAIDAAREFRAGFKRYVAEFQDKPTLNEVRQSLSDYYTKEFGKMYAESNGGQQAQGIEKRLETFDLNTLALQYSYIVRNSNPLGSKHLLGATQDGSSYSKAHAIYHPSFRSYLEEFSFYDVFIVDPDTGHVVYSVYKELDYATSLISGPYASTGLGEAFQLALKGKKGEGYIVDMKPYFPSYEAPAAFVSARIEDHGRLEGILVFQVPVNKIDSILTSDLKWKESGFGETGQVYIFGPDKLMRTQSRDLVENPDQFYAAIEHTPSKANLDYIRNKKSTILGEFVDEQIAELASTKNAGFGEIVDYRGDEVLVGYSPAEISGLNWYVVAAIDTSEALNAVVFGRIMMTVLVVSTLLIALFSWFFSSRLAAKIVSVVERLNVTSRRSGESSAALKDASQRVASATTEQASAIQETVATLNEITAMVNKSVDYATKSSDRAGESHEVSAKGKKAVEEMRAAMGEIDRSNSDIMTAIQAGNQKISKIVEVITEIANKTKVINDIVFQTKLLSFNASVEAARAGEHGKGFAVVAEEVGNLAQMSGTASKEIEDMLSNSISQVESTIRETNDSVSRLIDAGKTKVESGVAIAARCEDVLDEVVRNVAEVKSMMSEVAHGSNEQAEGVNNITTAMNQLDETTHSNSAIAQETSEYSAALSQSSEELASVVMELGREVHGAKYARGSEVKTVSSTAVAKPQSAAKKPLKVVAKPAEPKSTGAKVTKIQDAMAKAKAPVPPVAAKKVVGGFDVPDAADSRFEDV